jgi:hypothetical protein
VVEDTSRAGGTGNSPPVSPSQGNTGSNAPGGFAGHGGGGGGAGAAGGQMVLLTSHGGGSSGQEVMVLQIQFQDHQ